MNQRDVYVANGTAGDTYGCEVVAFFRCSQNSQLIRYGKILNGGRCSGACFFLKGAHISYLHVVSDSGLWARLLAAISVCVPPFRGDHFGRNCSNGGYIIRKPAELSYLGMANLICFHHESLRHYPSVLLACCAVPHPDYTLYPASPHKTTCNHS